MPADRKVARFEADEFPGCRTLQPTGPCSYVTSTLPLAESRTHHRMLSRAPPQQPSHI